jgi:hypothetical protein
LVSPLSAETPAPETLKAFDSYVRSAEAHSNEELVARKNFLWVDVLPYPERERTYHRLKRQQTIVRHSASCASRGCPNISGGLIHDWTGITSSCIDWRIAMDPLVALSGILHTRNFQTVFCKVWSNGNSHSSGHRQHRFVFFSRQRDSLDDLAAFST